MDSPKKVADTSRAEAQRARRLAATLSQAADQDRLTKHADELKAAKQDAASQKPVDRDKR